MVARFRPTRRRGSLALSIARSGMNAVDNTARRTPREIPIDATTAHATDETPTTGRGAPLTSSRTTDAARAAARSGGVSWLSSLEGRHADGVRRRHAHGATVMFVGEQPGDQEDLRGASVRRAVGAAARWRTGAADSIAADAYVTNAVKHFKWVPDRAASGASTRRLPRGSEGVPSVARRGDRGREAARDRGARRDGGEGGVRPGDPRHGAARQALRTPFAKAGFATVHPSAVLRAPGELRAEAEQAFVDDLRKVARYLARHTE